MLQPTEARITDFIGQLVLASSVKIRCLVLIFTASSEYYSEIDIADKIIGFFGCHQTVPLVQMVLDLVIYFAASSNRMV